LKGQRSPCWSCERTTLRKGSVREGRPAARPPHRGPRRLITNDELDVAVHQRGRGLHSDRFKLVQHPPPTLHIGLPQPSRIRSHRVHRRNRPQGSVRPTHLPCPSNRVSSKASCCSPFAPRLVAINGSGIPDPRDRSGSVVVSAGRWTPPRRWSRRGGNAVDRPSTSDQCLPSDDGGWIRSARPHFRSSTRQTASRHPHCPLCLQLASSIVSVRLFSAWVRTDNAMDAVL
jgi:hypothetical protein